LPGVVLSVQLEMRDQTGQAHQFIPQLQRCKRDVQVQDKKYVSAHAAKIAVFIEYSFRVQASCRRMSRERAQYLGAKNCGFILTCKF